MWIVYSKRDDSVGLPDIVYTHFGFLVWAAVATTALCLVLARRRARVTALQNVRRQLVSEAMQADERHNREVAEHLHDGPLQTLLAARLDLDEVRERNSDPALEAVHTALQETAAALRSTVTQLHPQVLAQLGLTPAIRELLRQFESRGEYTVDAELDDVGKPESQQLMYRAARELLANIHKHARAEHRVGGAVATGRPPHPHRRRRRNRFRSRRGGALCRRRAHRARLAARAVRCDGRVDGRQLGGRMGHPGDGDLTTGAGDFLRRADVNLPNFTPEWAGLRLFALRVTNPRAMTRR